jgi:superoxide dismutase, Fe-Mn family
MERNKIITLVGIAAILLAVIGPLKSVGQECKNFKGHNFPQLPYDYYSLEPFIDGRTMELHYSKHHRGYYDKFISATDGTMLKDTPLEKIFANVSKYSGSVRDNGGGFYNHTLFWENMTPDQGEVPEKLENAIEKDFGSFDAFKEQFSTTAKTIFGSGWAWLAIDENGKLFVTSTPNQDNPLMDVSYVQGTPLLALDVWEHAYYLKYQNRRAEYVDNFWNIINWKVVNDRLEKALSKK